MTLREQWESKAQQHGIQIGIEKGALESKKETAINMLIKGYNENDIAELTSLEKSVVAELKKVGLKKTEH